MTIEDFLLDVCSSARGHSWQSLRLLARLCFVIDTGHANIQSDGRCSIRSVFYRSMTRYLGLFEDQHCSDRCLRTLVDQHGLSRDILGFVSAPKGLIYAVESIKFVSRSSPVVFIENEFRLITPAISSCDYAETAAKIVLIVEKESIFEVSSSL